MTDIRAHTETLLHRAPELACCQASLEQSLQAMFQCYQADRHMFLCGNGGSCADAEHMAGELIKSFALPRPLPATEQQWLLSEFGEAGRDLAGGLQRGFRAQTLVSHPAYLTAMANDNGWDFVFAQQLYVFGRAKDLLIALSTSGQSSNILQALRVARLKELTTVALTGRNGGDMRKLTDICIQVPADDTPRIQERHQIVYHWLCASLEAMVFTEMDREPD